MTRREFLRIAAGTSAPLAVSQLGWAAMLVPSGAHHAAHSRVLNLFNVHTGESLHAVYWRNGRYLADALFRINYLLRDYRQNRVKPIDTRLLDLLTTLRQRLHGAGPFQVLSGYRCPATNAMLHAETGGVSAHSLHMEGKAIDIMVPGRSLARVRQVAWDMQRGGVGYYPGRFVHLDVGRVRWW
ncbi:MAG TPA: DUF882 domain-containing protein [Candidatus Binataceae bacterium]|nr:DUF882 domain-containing protein [Candidatus Binataceae bacterium]